jgi:pyruvate dehydrogenase E2 component (dihydrolipoamide acetyltransferase)
VHDVFIPVLGMAPDDVTLTSWLRQPGEAIEAGTVVAVVETSKAELEIESESSGKLGPHLFPAGTRLMPGTTITHVLAEHEVAPAPPALSDPAGRDRFDPVRGAISPASATNSHAPPPASVSSVSSVRHTTSPRARRIAAEAAERATEDRAGAEADAAAATDSPPLAPAMAGLHTSHHTDDATDDRTDRTTGTRAAIARAVTRSWTEIPHFTVSRELHVGDLVDTAQHWRAVLPRLTVTDLLLRALALAMVDSTGRTDLSLGLAVATEAGVVIPVIRRVPELGLVELVDARIAAVARARNGRMQADDTTVPATTLSNLGALGVDQFTGVIPHGSTSIVTVGRAAKRPVVLDGVLSAATTMWTTVNLDHREWDGVHGARLLDRLAAIVSMPSLFLGGGAPLATSTGPEATDDHRSA